MSTLTRASLAETIYAAVGLSRNESAVLLEAVLDRMKEALAQGESVKISGFGTFSVRQKGRRIGRNPKTGTEVPILPRRVLIFRPSQILREEVTKGSVASSPNEPHHDAAHHKVRPDKVPPDKVPPDKVPPDKVRPGKGQADKAEPDDRKSGNARISTS